MKHIMLSVPDMKCGGCTSAVEEALTGLPAVKKATANLETKVVDVELDDDVSLGAIVGAVSAAGYKATLLE
ncbi:MAG TPA: heavy metal-associated domain-containing protein [Gemmatimonadota bacterium]|nr:heavy metal-associated domain-containing protein [Gemmatimonadota bacterium]